MSDAIEKRNITMDAAKGFAIFLVIIGHIIENRYSNYQSSALFNVIWTLQMPIFFFISGYFNKGYFGSKKDLLINIKNRFFRILVPYLTYFYIIEILILGEYGRDMIHATKTLAFNIQYSLWFLFVNFVLSIMCSLVRYISSVRKNKLIWFFILYAAACIPWTVLAFFVSPDFLGTKFVIYYSIYFVLGILFSEYRSLILKVRPVIMNIIYLICMVLFLYVINNYETMNLPDSMFGIVIRVTAALTGMYILLITLKSNVSSRIVSFLSYFGKKSLELYITSCIITRYFTSYLRDYSTSEIPVILLYTVIITAISFVLIMIIKSNNITNTLFLGNYKTIKKERAHLDG